MVDATSLAYGISAAVGFAVAAGGGYLAGHRAALAAPLKLLRRAQRHPGDCLKAATTAIDVAGKLCEAVANESAATEAQLSALVERQSRLVTAIKRLTSAVQAAEAAPARAIEWVNAPVDAETDLPNRGAFEANAGLLIAAATTTPRGGVLFISIDDAVRLRNRVGENGYRSLSKSVGRVLCRAGRTADLTCRIDGETFAVLMSDEDPTESLSNANAIRDAFRNHPFRLGPDGPECLVTASFGFTPILPSDEFRIVTDRAIAAVTRSRRWGRNRLYGYDSIACGFAPVKLETQLAWASA